MGKLNRRPQKPKISRQGLLKSSDEEHCFVCNKKFKEKKSNHRISIGKSGDNNLFRHKKCDPLSENWRKKFGQPSITV